MLPSPPAWTEMGCGEASGFKGSWDGVQLPGLLGGMNVWCQDMFWKSQHGVPEGAKPPKGDFFLSV